MSSESVHIGRLPTFIDRDARQVESIQWLRGLAAMLVVYNHAALLALDTTPLNLGEWRSTLNAVAVLGSAGVDLFFAISGFVMAMSARRFLYVRGAWQFMALRYNRIAPLFYVMSAVMLAEIVRSGTPFTARELFNTVAFIPWLDRTEYSWPLHYLGWTLAFEFLFYGVVAACIVAGGRLRTRWLIGVLAVLPLIGFAYSPAWMPWTLLTSPLMWEFGFGATVFALWQRGWFVQPSHWWRFAIPLAVGAVLLPAVAATETLQFIGRDYLEPQGALYRTIFWGVPAAFVLAFFLTLPPRAFGRLTPLLSAIGNASYSLYLTHVFVVRLAREAIQRWQVDPTLAMLAIIVVSPVVAWLTWRLLEKPMQTAGQRVLMKHLPGMKPA